MHPNKDWYLVWLESSYPGEISINRGTQDRPLVTWSTMGGPLKLHLLTAPDIKSLLSNQIELASGINTMTPPPVEALGYYLCRDSGDLRRFRNDFNGMTKEFCFVWYMRTQNRYQGFIKMCLTLLLI